MADPLTEPPELPEDWTVRIPKDPELRRKLAEFAGLTDEERLAIDQWVYDRQRERAQGIVSEDEAGRR